MEKRTRFQITMNSPVVLIFVFCCFIATLLGEMTGGFSNQLLFMTYHSSLLSPLTYIRLFTHVFGHGGWDHFVGNMVYILLVGPLLEEKYGQVRLIEVIVLTSFVTGVVNYVLFPGIALCGASGVVFAFILLSSLTGFKENEIPLTFILVVVIFLGQQVVQGMFVQDNISNLSHILGGIVGAMAGFSFSKNRNTSAV